MPKANYQEAIRWFLDQFKHYISRSYHDINQAGGQYIRDASGVFFFFLSH